MGAQSDVDRYRKAIQDLQRKVGQESTKVADARQKAAKASQAATRSTSPSTRAMKLREVDREVDRANKAEVQRAKLEGQLADQTKKLHAAEAKLAKERDAAQAKNLRKLSDTVARSERQFRPPTSGWQSLADPPDPSWSVTGFASLADPPDAAAPGIPAYDLFISHASEDKEEIASPLAKALSDAGVRVWFDAFTLKVGDSLRRKIDEGLARSTFGVVILSPPFFAKQWPQAELDGLTAKATAADYPVILPIWHHISKEEVLARSPMLAGLLALNTSVMTLDEIVGALVDRVRS